MGLIDAVTDMTGSMSQLDINTENISNIIDELNRNSDQLDSIGNSLNIISRGTLSGTWDGTTDVLQVQQNHGFATAPIFLASFTRSDMVGQYFPMPMWYYDNSGNFQARALAFTDNNNIYMQFVSVVTGAPVTFDFSFYIIQQPAQVPTGS